LAGQNIARFFFFGLSNKGIRLEPQIVDAKGAKEKQARPQRKARLELP
jgi:hypothetical protein